MRHPILSAALLLVCSIAAPAPGLGQATTLVPVSDPAYADLDVLSGAGLVTEVMIGERPYSRAAFGRFVREASRRLAEEATVGSQRMREAIDRLDRRFGAAAAAAPARVGLSHTGTDLAAASSPGRPLRTGADGEIDGSVNPLLQRNGGRVLTDGLTAAFEGAAGMESRWVAAEFAPRIALDVPSGSEDPGVRGDVLAAYGRTVVGPVSLDVGRRSAVFGFGQGGGPFLSDNARGHDMVRVGAERPVRLPGPLAVLGLWQLSVAMSDMGEARDQPGSVLTLIRGSARPASFLEIGLNYANVQGGEGSPPATRWERIHDIFYFWQDGGALQISDKVVGADMRVSIPSIRTAAYVNFLTTDDRGRFQQPAGGYWEDAAWLVGADVVGVGAEGRIDLGLEWSHDGPRAHTHHQFTSGMTLDGRVLGDPLGPNAMGVSARVTWNGPRERVRATGSWEHYSGDDWYWTRIPGGEQWDYEWYLGSDNPDEVRTRLTLDWLRFDGWRGLETGVRLGYEHVTRFAYSEDGRDNLLAQVSLRWVP